MTITSEIRSRMRNILIVDDPDPAVMAELWSDEQKNLLLDEITALRRVVDVGRELRPEIEWKATKCVRFLVTEWDVAMKKLETS